MPTSKKRLSIAVDDDTYAVLDRLSSKRGLSVAGVGLELIKQALRYQEDLHFSRIADERLDRKEAWVSNDQAWRHPSLHSSQRP